MFYLDREEINTFIREINAIERIFVATNDPLVVNHKKSVETCVENGAKGHYC